MVRIKRWSVVVTMGLLFGCAGGGGDEAATGGQVETNGSQDSGEGASPSASTTPLALALGSDRVDPVATERRVLEEQRRREEVIAECMRAQGFEYVIGVPAEVGALAADDLFDGLDPTGRAFAERFGYGYTVQLEAELSADTGVELTESARAYLDYLDSLSPEELEAYDRALYGAAAQDADGDDQGAQAFSPGGCQGEAFAATGSFGEETFDELTTLLIDLNERIEADPRVVAATDHWAACMAEAGYTYRDSDEIAAEAQSRAQQIRRAASPLGGLSEAEVEAVSEEELSAALDAPVTVDPDLIAELEEWESAVALVDFDCREPVRVARLEAQVELEQAFVEDNGELIEQFSDRQE